MSISEKVAYLEGLAEGLALDTETKEGKLLAAIVDVLGEIAEELEEIVEEQADLEEGLEGFSIVDGDSEPDDLV